MVVEFYEHNPDFDKVSQGVADGVERLLIAEGVSDEVAFTVGRRAAMYSARLVFSGLDVIGADFGFDPADPDNIFSGAVTENVELTIHPETIPEHEAELANKMGITVEELNG